MTLTRLTKIGLSLMGRFLKSIWNFLTALKHITGNLLFLALLILIIVSIFTSEVTKIPDQTALVLDPTGIIVEQKAILDPFDQLIRGSQEMDAETLVKDLLDSIDKASTDDRVRALVLELQHLRGASLTNLQEIGQALDAFKAKGKPIYAFSDSFNQAQYYLAAHANHLYMNRGAFGALGGIYFQGLGVYPTFFKEALDKLKIQIHVFKVGVYKSAVEPFTRNNMSEASKVATLGWLSVLWDSYRNDIARLRAMPVDQFDAYINHFDTNLRDVNGDFGLLAKKHGFVDALMTADEFSDELSDLVGKNGNKYQQVGFREYLANGRIETPSLSTSPDKIAVIVAKGTILDGRQPDGTIGGKSLSKLIRQARDDKTVKALVLRVDSPGGSATASEQIRYELEQTQKAGKPVVVSMSGYAASGGYWISATADKILASPTTVTGSIGIFAILPNLTDSMDSLGIHSDGVGTTPLSSATNLLQPINPIFKSAVQQSIEKGYRMFIELVAKGRNMTVEEVDRIAQGRVWAGETALELGLVDALGNLDDAIAAAAELADVEDYATIYFRNQLSPRERIMRQLMDVSVGFIAKNIQSPELRLIRQLTGHLAESIRELTRLNDPHGIYLQCLQCKVF
ncbi:MAG: signal peptide peptidase SppA [Gammaproteobacteria bacterium]|nr:signal peptide peptidase SppA [Gammaproteobacteria bacterium]